MITRIRVKNFKSFEQLHLKLKKFNVLIGANASGKSNFVHILKFLRDIATSGLENAISIQGGIEYLRNMNIGPTENILVSIEIEKPIQWSLPQLMQLGIYMKTHTVVYTFEMRLFKKRKGFKIVREELLQKCTFFRRRKRTNTSDETEVEKIGEGFIHVEKKNQRFYLHSKLPEDLQMMIEKTKLSFNIEDFYLPLLPQKNIPMNFLLLEKPYFLNLPASFALHDFITEIAIYDFDPKMPKKATPITGKAELEENGENLSIIINNITKKKESRNRLFALVKEVLPFVETIDVEKFADRSLLFKLKETYFRKNFLPASLISDGTIHITALIIALYFEEKHVLIIEEPERNIHPSLLSRIVEMMKEASLNKQIIVTTHNPEIVKYTGLEHILLISRNHEGFSNIVSPSEKNEIKQFLKHDIGIEELYVDNILEAMV